MGASSLQNSPAGGESNILINWREIENILRDHLAENTGRI